MPRPIPEHIETLDSLAVEDDGMVRFAAVTPAPDQKPGYSGYLVPHYVLTDRGSFFVPGAGKKTAKEQKDHAPVLYQHDTWEPIGRHTDIHEDEVGLFIDTHINEAVPRGAEVMSNLRFGVDLGISIGYDRIADRSGTEKDEPLLNRKAAPAILKDVPINELRAITEYRMWESSPVTFPGIGTAKPSEVRSLATLDAIALLTQALKNRTISDEQGRSVRELIEAYQAFAVAGESHNTNDVARPDNRRLDVVTALAVQARLLAERIPA